MSEFDNDEDDALHMQALRDLAAARADAARAQGELNQIADYVMGYWPLGMCYVNPVQAVSVLVGQMAEAQRDRDAARAECEAHKIILNALCEVFPESTYGELPDNAKELRAENERVKDEWAKSADHLATALLENERLREDAERYLNAIFKMADDGWLMHGVEGMSDVQKAVLSIVEEHPEYNRRVNASRKEGS